MGSLKRARASDQRPKAGFRRYLPALSFVGLGALGGLAIWAGIETNMKLDDARRKLREQDQRIEHHRKAQRNVLAMAERTRDVLLRSIALPDFSGITEKDLDAVQKELQAMFPASERGGIPRTIDTLLKIFDRAAAIGYKRMELGVRSPADTLRKRLGDCDDKSVMLALMLNLVFGDSTRIISLESKEVGEAGHAYVRFDLSRIGGSDGMGTDRAMKLIASSIAERYGISLKEARGRVYHGTSHEIRTASADKGGGMAVSSWLSLDATESVPGGTGCEEGLRIVREYHPMIERIKEHYRVKRLWDTK